MKRKLFDQLAAAERTFFSQVFLSPVLRHRKVAVQIDGVLLRLNIVEPKGFEGWGVFQPLSTNMAKWTRDASLGERREYLNRLPRFRLVTLFRRKKTWFATPVNNQSFVDNRQENELTVVPVRLPLSCERFDTLITRFDGQNFWFDMKDPRWPGRVASQLREHLAKATDPHAIKIRGSLPAHRAAYRFEWERRQSGSSRRTHSDERRIQTALNRGGATYHSHRDIGNSFTVIYELNGEVHQSTVDKQNLSVQSAGICLDGMDANFDLQSLVGVIAEGQRTDQIHRM